MNIAIINDGVVSNIAVFDSLQAAQTLLGTDNIRAIPDGYGIGDRYDVQSDTWTLDPAHVAPVPEPIVEPTHIDYDETLLDLDYHLTLIEIMGGGESNDSRVSHGMTHKADIEAGKVCADCIGLIKGFAWQNLDTGKPKYGTSGMYEYCCSKSMTHGNIGTLPDVPGIMLHRSGHVGVYVGGGKAIEYYRHWI